MNCGNVLILVDIKFKAAKRLPTLRRIIILLRSSNDLKIKNLFKTMYQDLKWLN
jgi:hypothetical protein